MEREEYEIRDIGNKNKLIKRVLGFHPDDAIRNARLYGEYKVACITDRPTKPNIIDVVKT